MTITLQNGDFGTYLVVAEDGQDLLIQTDWDFPGIASTVGTVACAHKQAGQMIAEAQAFLDDHTGDEVEDPGFFG